MIQAFLDLTFAKFPVQDGKRVNGGHEEYLGCFQFLFIIFDAEDDCVIFSFHQTSILNLNNIRFVVVFFCRIIVGLFLC